MSESILETESLKYQKLLEAVDKLPKEAVETATKEVTRKGYDTTGYQYQYLVNVMNEVFGLEGWGFEYKLIKEIEGNYRSGQKYWEITTEIQLWALSEGKTAKRSCAGGHRAEMYSDALKGAITNGLKKTLALLGVGKRAYEGTLDEDYRPIPGGNADRIEANKQAQAEALASQAKLNREAEARQGRGEPTPEEIQKESREVFESAWAEARQSRGEPLAELKHAEPKPSIPLCPGVPLKPMEALRKEMDSLLEIQGVSRGAFISACVGEFKRVQGDWSISEWGKAVQYLKDMADGRLVLEVMGGQGSFRRFEEPSDSPQPKFKVQICHEIWSACLAKAKDTGENPEAILKTASSFMPKEEGAKLRFLTVADLEKATKESKWFLTTLRKLDVPEKEIPF